MLQNQLFEEIHEDHENLKDLLEKLMKTSDRAEKNRANLFEKVKLGMVPHMKAEEKVFYPALVKHKKARQDALESLEEHHVAEMVLRELDRSAKADEKWKAKLMVFKEIVEHHIEEEEGKIFEDAKEAFDEEQLDEIFEGFQKHKHSLKDRLQKRSSAAA